MPPNLFWFEGRGTSPFLDTKVLGRRPFTMVTTAANGQPAAAGYLAGTGRTLARARDPRADRDLIGISHIVSFNDPGLFAAFGLPAVLDGPHGVANAGPWRP